MTVRPWMRSPLKHLLTIQRDVWTSYPQAQPHGYDTMRTVLTKAASTYSITVRIGMSLVWRGTYIIQQKRFR